MDIFKSLLIVLLFSVITFSEVYQSQWVPIPGYSFYELYTNGGTKTDVVERKIQIISTNSMSWPDGRQAIVLFLQVEQKERRWLYKCIQYYDKNMQETGSMCYELRNIPIK